MLQIDNLYKGIIVLNCECIPETFNLLSREDISTSGIIWLMVRETSMQDVDRCEFTQVWPGNSESALI